MGCLVKSGILNSDKTLTQHAKDTFIKEVKELLIYGSEGAPSPVPFKCGDPIPPNPNITFEELDLENEEKYSSFHRDILKNKYEKFAAALDVESTHSLLPLIADPIALAGKFGVEIPALPFPDGFIPYFTGLLLPKFVLDLINAGVPEFFLPPLLAAKLPEFISLPSPPNIQPLIPAFPPPVPGISVEIPEIPSLPEVALADLYAVDAALATEIPKLLADLIAEIPKILLKLPDLPSVFSELCKKIRDSGVFGKTEPYENFKQAVDTVLSRKLMACLFLAALGSTIGVSEGSMGPAIADKVLNIPTPEKPPPTVDESSDAVRRVVQRAQSLGAGSGLSYGGEQSDLYIRSLYYYESACASFGAGQVSIYGFPLPQSKLPDKNIKWADLVAIFSKPRAALDFSENGPNSIGVDEPQGFVDYAKISARDASSCALFARACLYAGGAKNFYFLSHYPTATAIDALIALALVKDYRWVTVNQQTGAVELNEELLKFCNSQPDTGDTQSKISLWERDDKGVPISDFLKQHALPKEEKVCYYGLEMYGLETFPALEAGDILIVNSNSYDAHAIVVTSTRPAGGFQASNQKPQDFTYLLPSIQGYEGGQADLNNLGEPGSTDTGSAEKLLDKIGTGIKGVITSVGSSLGLKQDPTPAPAQRGTAIRECGYTVGYQNTNKSIATKGFWIGKTALLVGTGVTEATNFYTTNLRRVKLIIKTRNFLKLDQLADKGHEAAFAALGTIDNSAALSFIISALTNPKRLGIFVQTVYPAASHRPPKKKE